MSRYQSVCLWQRAQSFSIGAFSLYVRCKSVFSAQSLPFGAISYLVTLYESKVCQRQERGVRFVLRMTFMLSCPPPPPAAKRPLMESRHLPSMPPSGISTQANTYHRTHNQRETHTGNIHKEKLDAHAHTDTPWGREQREDTVMGETDAERLICE